MVLIHCKIIICLIRLLSANYIEKNSSDDLAKVVICGGARATKKKKSFFSSYIESFGFRDIFFLILNLLFFIQFTKFTVHAW